MIFKSSEKKSIIFLLGGQVTALRNLALYIFMSVINLWLLSSALVTVHKILCTERLFPPFPVHIEKKRALLLFSKSSVGDGQVRLV